MASPIENLHIYQNARKLEDAVYELVKLVPDNDSYALGNDLRRASAAVCHYICEAHQNFDLSIKMDCIQRARVQAELTQKLLGDANHIAPVDELVSEYTVVIKQSWGLFKYFRRRHNEARLVQAVQAADELVAARS